MVHEIKSTDWSAFCRCLTEQRADATVKLEVIEPDGVQNVHVGSAAMQSMVFNRTAGCSDSITLSLRNDREIVYEIVEPIKIFLNPSGAGDCNLLQIEAESGITFLTLHPPIHPQMLAGLKIK